MLDDQDDFELSSGDKNTEKNGSRQRSGRGGPRPSTNPARYRRSTRLHRRSSSRSGRR